MKMRIVFVGALWKGSTGYQRMVALQDLGHQIVCIDTESIRFPKIVGKIAHRFGYHLDTTGINDRLKSITKTAQIDIVWLDKVLSVSHHTLHQIKQNIPECQILFYSPDDMMIPSNQSRQYRNGLLLFDLYITTKSYNVAELKALGAREVLFIDNAFDPHTHRPQMMTDQELAKWQSEVSFVGGFEQSRYKMMLDLADADVSVSIHGPGWEVYQNKHPNLLVKPGWLIGQDYARAISAAKINLGFLRKVARDQQTTRSIEIPACGGFMLAERTEEHLRLFKEGQEAEYFAGSSELIQKAHYYLQSDMQRKKIAHAGWERCHGSGYSNQDRLKYVLQHLHAIRLGKL